MYITNKNSCKDCIMLRLCKKNNVNQSIIKKCNSLDDIKKRVTFANDNNLIPKLDKTFAQNFWGHHDFNDFRISLKIFKENFENPTKIFPNQNPQLIKDHIYVETLMKFCKLAEDLGALISSNDGDMYEFSKKYNEYSVSDVIDFYKNLTLSEKEISKIFLYPKIENQKSNESKDILQISYDHTISQFKEIKENYLKYRNVYNSYKHGYRIRFNKVDLTINPKSKEEMKYNQVLSYYDKNSLKKNPFSIKIMAYEKYNDFHFDIIHNSCLSIIMLIQVFLNNFINFQEKSGKIDIQLFFDPYMFDLINKFELLSNKIEFN